MYFDIKSELRSKAGIGSKPDGIVVVFDKSSYYIVENERAEHGVHDHVVTQISKFNTAFKKPENKKKVVEAIYDSIRGDPLKEFFVKSKIEGDLYKFLTDIFSSKPVVVIIIDELLDELEEAVEELPLESKIIEFKTFIREDAPNIHAHLFEPLHFGCKGYQEGTGVKKPASEHNQSWEKKLAWVDANVREVVQNLAKRINAFSNVSQKTSGTDYCFYKGKPSSKSIFAVFMLRQKLLKVRIRADPKVFKDTQKWVKDKMFNWFIKQGQEREFEVKGKEQIAYAMELIRQSYKISGEPEK